MRLGDLGCSILMREVRISLRNRQKKEITMRSSSQQKKTNFFRLKIHQGISIVTHVNDCHVLNLLGQKEIIDFSRISQDVSP